MNLAVFLIKKQSKTEQKTEQKTAENRVKKQNRKQQLRHYNPTELKKEGCKKRRRCINFSNRLIKYASHKSSQLW